MVKFIAKISNEWPKLENNVFNLASGNPTSIKELYESISGIGNFSQEPEYVPSIKEEVNDNYLDCSRAKREIGWNPTTPLEEGLKHTIDYLKNGRI